MFTYLVRQDGGDFYLYNPIQHGFVCSITSPHKVRDFDVTKAEQQRRWFKELMASWNVPIRFEGE